MLHVKFIVDIKTVPRDVPQDYHFLTCSMQCYYTYINFSTYHIIVIADVSVFCFVSLRASCEYDIDKGSYFHPHLCRYRQFICMCQNGCVPLVFIVQSSLSTVS